MDVLCDKCGKSFSVDERQAGAEAPCPRCGASVRLPSTAGDAGPLPPPEEADEFLVKARLALKKKMLLTCPGCSLKLVVQRKLSGKVIQCPACSREVTVPTSFMPAEAEAMGAETRQRLPQSGPVQAGTFEMPAIAVYEDSSPVRWLALAVAAIILSTAAGFATGYFVLASTASHAPAQTISQPAAAPVEPAAPAPPAPERVIR